MNTIGQREALSRTGTPTGPSAMARSRPDGEYNLASYAYDAQSRLISRSVGVSPTTATAYIHDGWNRIAEYEINNQNSTIVIRKSYLWGPDLSGAFQGAGGVGGLLAVNRVSSTMAYPAYDGNGNITEYLDATGGVLAHFEYDPFGNTVVSTDYDNSFAYRFSTKPIDQATGWYYYGYRWYDPLTGRWPSRDPIGEQGGVNLYGFVGNDGVGRVDVLGMWWLSPSHEGLTGNAWDELGLGGRYPDCPALLADLKSANVATDKKPYSDMNHLQYHFNRRVGQAPVEAKVEYGLARVGLKIKLLKFQWKEGAATREECADYLANYGRLLHTSQDYYGHAVANTAVDDNSHVGVLNGDPDSPSPDFKPSSYAGFVGKDEHGSPPRDGEPGTRNGQQGARTRQTIDFTKKDMREYLDSYYAKCRCFCKERQEAENKKYADAAYQML